MRLGLAIALVAACVLSSAPNPVSAAKGHQVEREVFKRVGRYSSPDGRCAVVVKHAEGDRFTLEFEGTATSLSNDFTGGAWLDSARLVFTSSPVYGKPGVFTSTCGDSVPIVLVSPNCRDSAYPDGCDYFELVSVGRGANPVIALRYAPDVDAGRALVTRSASIRSDGRDARGLAPEQVRR